MRGGIRFEGMCQGPLTLGFNKMKRVFNPYMGTHGGPS